MKIHPVGAELFHVDRWKEGRTDGHDEANSRFSKFCERALKYDQHGLMLISDKPAFFSGVKYWCAIWTDGSTHGIVCKDPRFVPRNFLR